MSKTIKLVVGCPECGSKSEQEFYSSINTSINPELRQVFFDMRYNFFTCESCSFSAPFFSTPIMYHDPKNRFVVWVVAEEALGTMVRGHVEKIKDYDRIFGKNNHFSRSVFVTDRLSASILARIFTKAGLPSHNHEVEEYKKKVGEFIRSFPGNTTIQEYEKEVGIFIDEMTK